MGFLAPVNLTLITMEQHLWISTLTEKELEWLVKESQW